MEIEEQNNETCHQFVNFSIRDYVAEICKKDWKKCWPFGSLCDPKNKLDEVFVSEFLDFGFFSSRNRPNHMNDSIDDSICKTAYDGSSEPTSSKSNDGQCRRNEKSVNEGAKIGTSDHEPGRKAKRRKRKRFVLLSDLLRELAGPSGERYVRCDLTNADNVNSRFANETEDESDEDDHVPLGSLFRKQTSKRKKMKTILVDQEDKGSEKTRIDDVDSNQRLAKRKKSLSEFRQNEDAFKTEKDAPKRNSYVEATNEDSEMEAVMLLARRFNEAVNPSRPSHGATISQTVQSGLNPPAEPGPGHGQRFANINVLNKNTKPVCACVQKKIREGSTTNDPVFYTDTHKKLTKEKLEDMPFSVSAMTCQADVEIYTMTQQACLINRNPADFTIPQAGNLFMRGG